MAWKAVSSAGRGRKREEMTQGRIRAAVSPGAVGAFRRVSVGRPDGSQVLKA